MTPLYESSQSEVDPVTGGPAYMLSPSLPLGSPIWTMGELVITIASGITTLFSLFNTTFHNHLLRCMGHIVNLAQQSFICVLTGGMDDPKLQDGDEPDLSGPEDSVIGGAPIRPLLMHVQALVVWVSLSICIVCNSDTVCLGLKVSWCKALPEGVLHQSLNKTTGTHNVWGHALGLMSPVASEIHPTIPSIYYVVF